MLTGNPENRGRWRGRKGTWTHPLALRRARRERALGDLVPLRETNGNPSHLACCSVACDRIRGRADARAGEEIVLDDGSFQSRAQRMGIYDFV